MSDIALRFTQASPTSPPVFDIAIEGADLAHDDGLRTAVLLSLFTDRRAEPDDAIEGDDRRGWWGGAIGSRLWLLAREKETPATLQRARAYAEEALAWLIEDGIARRVQTEAEWVRRGVLGVAATITLADGSVWAERLQYPMGV